MKNIIITIAVLSLFLISACTVDELDVEPQEEAAILKEKLKNSECNDAGGTWRAFSNGCVDKCYYGSPDPRYCTAEYLNGCDCGPDNCWDGTTCISNEVAESASEQEEARKLIEDTFKLNISVTELFPINESLRYCNNAGDCTLVSTEYCGYYEGGSYGYINSQYAEKWEEERTKWKSRGPASGCYQYLTDYNEPKCENSICVW